MEIYKGYDIIYDEEYGGYYAQDFSKPEQPCSKLYDDYMDVKNAIDLGTIFKAQKRKRKNVTA